MRRKTTLVLLLIGYCIGLFVSPAKGEIFDIFYSDGQVHIIDSPMNNTRVVCSGEFTTVDVVEGGSLYELQTFEHSRGILSGGTIYNLISFDSYVSISGGTVFNELNAYGSSQVEMSGGAIGYWDEYFIYGILQAHMDSQIMVSGGWISRLSATDESQVSISGDATIGSSVDASGNSQITVSISDDIGFVGASGNSQITVYEGAIRALAAIENGQVTVYGMSMSELLDAENEGIMTFYGSEFYVDYQQVYYGEITSIFGGNTRDEPRRELLVRFDNGEWFAAPFYIGHNASIVLVPEPSTPPVADADGPYTIYVGDTLILDGGGSTDDDNDIVSYKWDLDDDGNFETDAGSQPVFDVNFAELQSLGLLINHTYTIHLKVTDSEGQSDVNDSTLIIVPKPALAVAVDIKPSSCPNPLNTKSSGVLPVAILGTQDVNVINIDPTSIAFSIGDVNVGSIRCGYEDVAAPVSDSNDCNCTEEGPDGFLDLTLKFGTQEIVKAIGDVNDGDILTLPLTGVLYDPPPFERPIEGADCILIKGKYKAQNKADFNADKMVDMLDFAIFADNWLQSSAVED